ncbi:hypothetical protein OH76DRAFT_538037 [Lentinus brumalis]|uniref:Uncharacterized protein n=1 Tax=Lentinus brumalis TaxID=2498619 RepID=A0A371CHM3_9APHY|nr:hypothetical protein OH76DRAFT_538037 [Polyporus brumalis]
MRRSHRNFSRDAKVMSTAQALRRGCCSCAEEEGERRVRALGVSRRPSHSPLPRELAWSVRRNISSMGVCETRVRPKRKPERTASILRGRTLLLTLQHYQLDYDDDDGTRDGEGQHGHSIAVFSAHPPVLLALERKLASSLMEASAPPPRPDHARSMPWNRRLMKNPTRRSDELHSFGQQA